MIFMLDNFREMVLVQRVTEGLYMRNLIEGVLIKAGCKMHNVRQIINPYLYQLEDGSPLVVEDYYGVPNKIYTPVGYIPINLDYNSWDKLHIRKQELFFEILEELDITQFQEPIKSDYGYLGGWRKQGNGKPVYRERDTYVEYNAAMSVYNKALRDLDSTCVIKKVSF